MSNARARRALLFVPGDSERKISKGAAVEVDSVILDLEDGVAFSMKEEARETVRRLLSAKAVDFGRSERLIRINGARPDDAAALAMQALDVQRTIEGRPDGYVIPKVESPAELLRISALLREQEELLGLPLGQIQLLAMIETPLGVVNLREIAQADAHNSKRLVALLFGAEDFVAEVGALRSASKAELLYARSAVVLHATAFGLMAIDTPSVELKEMESVRLDAVEAMQMGFAGKLAIHPAQIEPIVAAFTPSTEAVAAASRLLEAYQVHQAEGTGAFAYEGKMVDRPILAAAERLLARAKRAGE